jgi:hypothetical protein
VVGCQNSPQKSAEPPVITLYLEITKTEKFSIDDSQQYLSTNPQYTSISQDSALIADSQGYYLYVNQKFVKIIGKIGSTSGEYKFNKAYTINGDTLFIYDQVNSKIIGYSLTTNTCIYEKYSPVVAQKLATSILRHSNYFILGDCAYYPSELRPQNNIFALLYDGGKVKEMQFSAKQSPSYSVIPSQVMPSFSSRLRFSQDRSQFYTCILFSPYVIVGDIKSKKISTVPIELAMSESTKIINGKLPNADKIIGAFPLRIGFATVSFVIKEERANLAIRYYSVEGKKLGELLDTEIGENILFVTLTDDYYELLKMNEPGDKLATPYSLIRKSYTK